MTFNIRLNLPSDGDNAWPNRKDMAASMIRFYAPDMFGVQEAFVGQVNDLAERLLDYDWIGVGRDDGNQAGEYMAIFYLKSRKLHEKRISSFLRLKRHQKTLAFLSYLPT